MATMANPGATIVTKVNVVTLLAIMELQAIVEGYQLFIPRWPIFKLLFALFALFCADLTAFFQIFFFILLLPLS